MNRLTNAQIARLAEMHTYCRPHGKSSDIAFRTRYIEPFNPIEDAHGNLFVRVGTSSILWSSHTDTVHMHNGMQDVHIDRAKKTISLTKRARKHSSCLGGDDTVGVFLMCEMITRRVPGVYVFHYGEESGCIGSSALADYTPESLDGIQYAIALDRAGTSDVITTQLGGRCASLAFADSLGAHMQKHGLLYTPARGIYTDTAEYMHLVPECSNLSVGYYHAHSPREYVDYAHVGRLLQALCTLRDSDLVCARTPDRRTWTPSTTVTRIDAPIWSRRYEWSDDDEDDYTTPVACTPKRARAWHIDGWCIRCDAPVTSVDCVCEDEDDYNVTADDRKFLKYLKGL